MGLDLPGNSSSETMYDEGDRSLHKKREQPTLLLLQNKSTVKQVAAVLVASINIERIHV